MTLVTASVSAESPRRTTSTVKRTPAQRVAQESVLRSQPEPARREVQRAPEPIDPAYGDSSMDYLPYYDGPAMAGPCGPAGCGVMGMCTQHGIWVDLDYLLWARRGRYLPALVTTEPNGGVLPGATVVFGDNREGAEMRPGGRVRIGTWLDACGIMAVEGSFLALGDGRVSFNVDSSEMSTIARPFFNLTDNLAGGVVGQDALQVALAGTSTGSLSINSSSDVAAWDVIFRGLLHEAGHTRLDLLAGYQGARIDEDLVISSSTTLLANSNQIDVVDSFATDNVFHGGAIGFELVHTYNRWNLELLGKVGFGNMKQAVTIDGQQTVTVPPSSTTSSEGGLLAQPTNIGRYTRDEFAVNPEVGVTLNYQLTECINLTTGYSFLYWNKVLQPGDQLDPQLAVNPDQPPAPAVYQRPSFDFKDGSYYIHGLHFGVQFVW